MKVSRSHAMRVLPFFVISSLSLTIGYGQAPSLVLLDRLQGEWDMTGMVMKKPVRYSAEGMFVLKNQFLSFHMKDVAVPSAYEANLYIGIDSSENQYIAHWLDSFGGAGARVVGVGPFSPEKIEIVYPYSGGRFRNLFNYDSKKDEWTLVIESESPDGHWSPFAQYNITRKR
jgi:hypothetical protein